MTHLRLSQSSIWDRQRTYFETAGVDAWRSGTVPHQVTSNPVLAAAYARVIRAFRRDLGVDRLNVIELGAGSGRFSFLLLKCLDKEFSYVMSDRAESNLRFWRSHEALRPFAEAGRLEFACLDLEANPEALNSSLPTVVIANYVFDGLTHDAFEVRNNVLNECFVGPGQQDGDGGLETHMGTPVANPYVESMFNDVLKDMTHDLEDGRILVPLGALRCIAHLANAPSPVLLLVGDRGFAREQSASHVPEDLGLAQHGSISLPVNFPLMSRFVRLHGGTVFEASHVPAHLNIVAYALDREGNPWTETQGAFEDMMERDAPDDIYAIRRGIKGIYSQLDSETLLAIVRQSRYDPWVMGHCLPHFWPHLAALGSELRHDLRAAALACFANYFHLGETYDFPFALGLLLYELRFHEDALRLFEESVRLNGDDAATRWNIALCHVDAGRSEKAAECLGQAKTLSPDLHLGGLMRTKVSAQT